MVIKPMKASGRKNISRENLFRSLFNRAKIALNDHQLSQIVTFHDFLRKKDPELNLTRIHNLENMIRKHYIDSLIILDILKQSGLALTGRIMDLGSGPGFPGIPLAIALPDTFFYLTEGRKNRCEFLREAIATTGIKNAEVIERKVTADFFFPVDAVITRAFASMEETFVRTGGVLARGGKIFFMKGPHCDDEIQSIVSGYGNEAQLLLDHHYSLPESPDRRRLVVYQRHEVNSLQRGIDPVQSENPITHDRQLLYQIAEGKWVKLHNRYDISSRANARFSQYVALQSGRMIKKLGKTLVAGKKIISDLIEEKPEICHALILSEKMVRQEVSHSLSSTFSESEIVEKAGPVDLIILAQDLFEELDTAGTAAPLLEVAVPEIQPYSAATSRDVTLFLPLSNPENLGAAIRSAVAMGFDEIVLLAEAANPFLMRSVRASAGAVFHARLYSGPSLLSLNIPFPLYALDREGENILKIKPVMPCGILVGMEGSGLPESIPCTTIAIPQSSAVESLNATVALSIALFQFRNT